MTIKVKPLVWEPYPNPALAGPDVAIAKVPAVVPYYYQAQRDPWAHSFIAYAAPQLGSETWLSSGHETIESAKAAAQADYEARILSAIEAVDPATIREKALREAASVRWDRRYGDDWLGMSCAILALIDKEQDK